MRRFLRYAVPALVLASAMAVADRPTHALDPDAVVSPSAGPLELFAQGFKAYQRGEKTEAVAALRYAADKGHAGARWKLGRMYADGDGVDKDDYEAFKIFESIVREHQEDDGAGNAAYVASAIVALGDYLRTGIPNSPVQPNLAQARQFYFHAASYFGSTRAQFQLGRMLLNGEGGSASPRQAARWLKLAAEKHDPAAQALLGYLLFDGEKIAMDAEPVRGLAMLTLAMRSASPNDMTWIRPLQEQAFSLASEAERRTAIAYVQEKSEPIATTAAN